MINKIKTKIGTNWLFLILVLIIYLIFSLINFSYFTTTLDQFLKIIIKIIPVVILVFFFLFLTDLFLKKEQIIKYLGHGSGLKGWLIAVTGGILSHGPIYMWYPLLADLKAKGMKNNLIATFLYNRAVKIPIIPLLIYYFGWPFFIILTIYMIIASIINGWIVGKLVKN